jgi:hypothetical protein
MSSGAARRRLMSTPSRPAGDPQRIAALQRAVHQTVGAAGLSAEQMANAELVSATFTYRVTDQAGVSKLVTIPMTVPLTP